jgi:hypothetical protein
MNRGMPGSSNESNIGILSLAPNNLGSFGTSKTSALDLTIAEIRVRIKGLDYSEKSYLTVLNIGYIYISTYHFQLP